MRYRVSSILHYRLDAILSPWQRQARTRAAARLRSAQRRTCARLAARPWQRRRDHARRAGPFPQQVFLYSCRHPRSGAIRSTISCSRPERGFCEHFSAAFVFLMRAAGIPARVVTGYLGGYFNAVGNYLARAPVRCARLGRGLAARQGLDASRSDRGRESATHRTRRARRSCRCQGALVSGRLDRERAQPGRSRSIAAGTASSCSSMRCASTVCSHRSASTRPTTQPDLGAGRIEQPAAVPDRHLGDASTAAPARSARCSLRRLVPQAGAHWRDTRSRRRSTRFRRARYPLPSGARLAGRLCQPALCPCVCVTEAVAVFVQAVRRWHTRHA